MSNSEINIDRIIDYKTEYSQGLEKVEIKGNQLSALCPFHDDSHASLSVDLKTGQYNCFACGASGNFVSFYAFKNGVDNKEAYKQILDKYGVDLAPKKAKQSEAYTLTEYAFEKRIPEEWLVNQCRLSGEKDRDGTGYIRIPYYDEDANEQTFRKRYRKTHIPRFKWKYGSKGKIIMYGEWRLPAIRKKGYTVVVEGESDTQSLLYMKLPALGIPGASMFNAQMSEKIDGLKLYIHKEPDHGGSVFVQTMTTKLRDNDFHGEVYVWSCKQFDCKDPSELFIKLGPEEAKAKIKEALKNAEKIDLSRLESIVPNAIQGAPINLRQPLSFEFSNDGIFKIDDKTGLPNLFCKTPLLITKRLKNANNGNEKIEIAFKRDGIWKTAVFPRSTIFQAKSIVTLADLGCTVTSENAKMVVQFLAELESENIDVIKQEVTTSVFGWQDDGSFLPGTSTYTLDVDSSLQKWADAYSQSGTYEEWLEMMRPHRQRNHFRFILASAFAAPLLNLLKQRIFIVYNWGGSRGGKTATIKAALSAWGDPDKLMINMNATQVAIERMAGFYCDLPLGIDERQLADKNQATLEKIVYMLASGTGRARGTKGGGLQTMHTWKTIALMSGEEPITNENSMTGVSTRVLELYGGPFSDEKAASQMHRATSEIYGWAGEKFIKILINNEDSIKSVYDEMFKHVDTTYSGTNNGHVASIAIVATADALIDSWLFKNSPTVTEESKDEAKQMATQVVFEQMSSEIADVNENAKSFVVDWVLSNKSNFDSSYNINFGFVEMAITQSVYIYSSILQNALVNAGFSPRKTLKYFAEQGLIETSVDASTGKVRFSTVRRNGDSCIRMIKFNMAKAMGNDDKIQDEDPDDGLPF